MRQKVRQDCIRLALGALWLLAVGAGLARVWRYDAAAGVAAQAPTALPAGVASLPRDAGQDTLVMVVHPQCPCSRASLEEMNRLLALCPGRVTADVLFVRYAGMTDAWAHSDTWRQAAAIPGVHVRLDPGGALARRLGARTSGQTYLYDPAGRLLFSGGLTGARGHEGDNAGLAAAVALLQGRTRDQTPAPVFGCPLFDDSRNARPCRRPK